MVGEGVADCLDLPKPIVDRSGGVPVRGVGASGGGVASLGFGATISGRASGFFSVSSEASSSEALTDVDASGELRAGLLAGLLPRPMPPNSGPLPGGRSPLDKGVGACEDLGTRLTGLSGGVVLY